MVNQKKDSKGMFEVDYASSISGFANAMKKFPLKNILYRTIFRGKGLEFDSYRNFEADDDASMIDWKASLRGNQLLAKKYIEERELHVYFVVDASSTVLFGSDNKLKAEFNAELVAALAHLVLGSGDKVGLILLNNEISKFIRPDNGKNQFSLLTDFLKDTKLYGGEFDLKKGIDFVLDIVKTEYSVFIIISDFIGLKRNSFKSLKFLSSKFESLGIMVRDKLDEELPRIGNQIVISDPVSGRQMLVDPKLINERFKENVNTQKKAVRNLFKDVGIDLLELSSNESFFSPLTSFLLGRAKGGRI